MLLAQVTAQTNSKPDPKPKGTVGSHSLVPVTGGCQCHLSSKQTFYTASLAPQPARPACSGAHKSLWSQLLTPPYSTSPLEGDQARVSAEYSENTCGGQRLSSSESCLLPFHYHGVPGNSEVRSLQEA